MGMGSQEHKQASKPIKGPALVSGGQICHLLQLSALHVTLILHGSALLRPWKGASSGRMDSTQATVVESGPHTRGWACVSS